MAEVRRVVPFDAYLFMLTDPATRVGNLTAGLKALATLPWPRLPALIRARYLHHVEPLAGAPRDQDSFGLVADRDRWRPIPVTALAGGAE